MSEYIYATDGHEGHWLTGEEIVRCRDCKHNYEGACERWDYCDIDDHANGFCAWGEKREQ